MGKASRQTRERPKARSWTTMNPWTRQPDTFMVRISDESLREWGRDRVRLKGQGYPDRPPEFDSPTMRGWDDHPDGLPPVGTAAVSLAVDPSAQLVGSWLVSDKDYLVKAHLGRRPDGELILDVSMGRAASPRRDLIRGVKSMQVAREIANEAAAVLDLPRPAFTTAAEFTADLERSPFSIAETKQR